MSIYKFFKPLKKPPVTPSDESTNKVLLDPKGPLTKVLSSSAIKMVNDDVAKVYQKTSSSPDEPISNKRGKYLTLTPAQRFEVGKRAAEHGVTSALRYFQKKYPDLALKETSVRRLRNLYQEKMKIRNTEDEATTSEVQEMPCKKSGRPLLLPDKLDLKVQECIKELRRNGASVGTSVVVATAQGVIMNKNANLLVSNGGYINLTDEWAKSLQKRMGFVKRKASSSAKITPEEFDKQKKDFLRDIRNVISMDQIPSELIVNFDQTGISYVPASSYTMEKEGATRVEVTGKDDKRQITLVFAGSLSGDFLPPQVIYEGKTKRCLPLFQFPSTWNITYTPTHWSNEESMKEYVEAVIFPYIRRQKANLKLPDDQGSLLIFDNFKAQITSSILTLLDSHYVNVVLIPANCTDRLQPMDLSVNKAAKDFLRSQFTDWYAHEVCSNLEEEDSSIVDLKLSRIKPLHAQWMVTLYNHIKSNPDIVKNGFKKAGILDSLSLA